MLGFAPDEGVAMDALSAENTITYGGLPPLLIAASSEAALRRARDTAEASGLRVGAHLGIDEARERLKQQASASAIWIEVDRDCGDSLMWIRRSELLLARLLGAVRERSSSRDGA